LCKNDINPNQPYLYISNTETQGLEEEFDSNNEINIILKSVSPSLLGGSKEEFEDWLKTIFRY